MRDGSKPVTGSHVSTGPALGKGDGGASCVGDGVGEEDCAGVTGMVGETLGVGYTEGVTLAEFETVGETLGVLDGALAAGMRPTDARSIPAGIVTSASASTPK